MRFQRLLTYVLILSMALPLPGQFGPPKPPRGIGLGLVGHHGLPVHARAGPADDRVGGRLLLPAERDPRRPPPGNRPGADRAPLPRRCRDGQRDRHPRRLASRVAVVLAGRAVRVRRATGCRASSGGSSSRSRCAGCWRRPRADLGRAARHRPADRCGRDLLPARGPLRAGVTRARAEAACSSACRARSSRPTCSRCSCSTSCCGSSASPAR